MRAVNLLPRDAMRPGSGQGRRLPVVVAAGGIVVATVTSAFLAFSASGTADERRAELALTEAAVAAVPSPEQPGTSTGFVVQERADRIAALSAALSSRVAVDRVLRELSFVLPADAWLTGLIAKAPSQTDQTAAPPGGASASPGAAGVTIQGATFSHESVARVLARLSVLPTLENVRLTASARIQPSVNQSADTKQTQRKQKKHKKQRTVVTFTISADLRPGGKS